MIKLRVRLSYDDFVRLWAAAKPKLPAVEYNAPPQIPKPALSISNIWAFLLNRAKYIIDAATFNQLIHFIFCGIKCLK